MAEQVSGQDRRRNLETYYDREKHSKTCEQLALQEVKKGVNKAVFLSNEENASKTKTKKEKKEKEKKKKKSFFQNGYTLRA